MLARPIYKYKSASWKKNCPNIYDFIILIHYNNKSYQRGTITTTVLRIF